MQKLKTIPFFLVLLALFFCLHGSAENFGSLTVKEVVLTGLSVLGVTLALFGVIYLFKRKALFAALVAFFIALWYFFFGAIHDFIKSVSFLSFFKSYSVILPLLFIATILWIIFLKKKSGLWQKLTLYLNILLLIYCVLDVFKISYYAMAKQKPTSPDTFNYAAVKQKPDVFFLLFDEYPGQKSLKDSFDFDNHKLVEFMRRNQFAPIPVTSNYDLTVFSMSSMLNMDYIKTKWHLPSIDQKDVQNRSVEIKQAAVFYYFTGMGYKIHNNSIFDIQNSPGISDENSFLLGHSMLLTDKILIHRINKDIGAAIPESISKWLPFIDSKGFYQHREDNAKVERNIISSLRPGTGAEPVFSYSHFMLPHGPYYYDSLGRESSFKRMNLPGSWTFSDDFISYLKYTNTIVEKVVSSLRKAKPNSIVIVMSDHGFREYRNDNGQYQPARFDNMCWAHFPDSNYGDTTHPLSNVNFFRYLFNTRFGQQMRYLGDSYFSVRFIP